MPITPNTRRSSTTGTRSTPSLDARSLQQPSDPCIQDGSGEKHNRHTHSNSPTRHIQRVRAKQPKSSKHMQRQQNLQTVSHFSHASSHRSPRPGKRPQRSSSRARTTRHSLAIKRAFDHPDERHSSHRQLTRISSPHDHSTLFSPYSTSATATSAFTSSRQRDCLEANNTS